MFCPESVIVCTHHLYIVRHEKADYHRGTPWAEVLNPLRYQINFGCPPRFTINKGAKWNMRAANLAWKLWGKRAWEKKRALQEKDM